MRKNKIILNLRQNAESDRWRQFCLGKQIPEMQFPHLGESVCLYHDWIHGRVTWQWHSCIAKLYIPGKRKVIHISELIGIYILINWQAELLIEVWCSQGKQSGRRAGEICWGLAFAKCISYSCKNDHLGFAYTVFISLLVLLENKI